MRSKVDLRILVMSHDEVIVGSTATEIAKKATPKKLLMDKLKSVLCAKCHEQFSWDDSLHICQRNQGYGSLNLGLAKIINGLSCIEIRSNYYIFRFVQWHLLFYSPYSLSLSTCMNHIKWTIPMICLEYSMANVTRRRLPSTVG